MKHKRIFLVGKEQVAIIKSYNHTYHVRFVKSGKFMEVHKSYVKSWTPQGNPVSKKEPKTNSQTSLDL